MPPEKPKPPKPAEKVPSRVHAKVLFLRIPKDLHDRMVKASGKEPGAHLPTGRRRPGGGPSLNTMSIEVLEKAFPKEPEGEIDVEAARCDRDQHD